MAMQDEQAGLILNLLALGFDRQAFENKYRCQFDEHTFDKPNKRAFEIIAHFLFHKLHHKQAAELFRTCFPATDKKSTQEFRKVSYNWLKRISEENAGFGLPKVSTTLLMSPGGKDFVHLVFMFSTFVLHKSASSVEPNGVLQPLQVSSLTKGMQQVQIKCLKAITLKEYQAFQREIQLIKKQDEELQAFADEQIKVFHTLQKRKKMLLQKKRHMFDDSNYSEMKKAEARKQRQQKIQAKINATRSLWNCIADGVEATATHREVLDSVIGNPDNGRKIDGGKLHPSVPAKLIDECQEEIYQTVGTSLYEAGKINLASLVSLGNLSLTLVLDKLHEDGLPNFERQNSWLKTCTQVHRNEVLKLNDLGNAIQKEIQNVTASIQQKEKELDTLYKASTFSALDVPDSSKTTKSENQPDLSKSEISFDDKQDREVISIAEKYLLPSGDPALFMRSIVSPPDGKRDHKWQTSRQEATNDGWLAWTIPTTTPKPVSVRKKKLRLETVKTMTKSASFDTSLEQGQLKHPSLEERMSASLRRQLTASHHAEDPVCVHSKHNTPQRPKKKSKLRGRKSVSLPSSPVTGYQTGDVTIEKVASRTPEAEQKLIDQIVNCTLQDQQASPLIVYQEDTKSQLDRSAFVSREKIQRTPPQSHAGLLLPRSARLGDSESQNSADETPSLPGLSDFHNDSSADFSRMNDISPPTKKENEPDLRSVAYEARAPPVVTINKASDSSYADTSDSSKFALPLNPAERKIELLGAKTFSDNLGSKQESSIVSAIDNTLANLFSGETTSLLDMSASSRDEFERLACFMSDDEDELVPVTNTLVSLDNEIVDVYANPTAERSNTAAIDLLMSTPPPMPYHEDIHNRKENAPVNPFSPMWPASLKEVEIPETIQTPDRPLLQEFQLNLLPTSDSDLQTPDLQRFKSILTKTSAND